MFGKTCATVSETEQNKKDNLDHQPCLIAFLYVTLIRIISLLYSNTYTNNRPNLGQ
jgi:hypothetical protein